MLVFAMHRDDNHHAKLPAPEYGSVLHKYKNSHCIHGKLFIEFFFDAAGTMLED